MERTRWSRQSLSFRTVVDNPGIEKPALVRIGGKAVIVGEKVNGEFIMASPCKVSGDRFEVMQQEIVLSSKHTGVWRVISKTTSTKENHIHRLSTKDLEHIHRQDVHNERLTPRSYICIRNLEAFELIVRHNDPTIVNGRQIERRIKQIDEDVEFEINDAGEVEYTPSEGERTSQDYTTVPKIKQGILLQFILPGFLPQEELIRNRAVRALYCTTKSEPRKRHFLLEVSEQPCEIRPIASEGSTDLRYLHSTQNLFDYMASYDNDIMLYVKLLRGDPPIKAIEFDGYMVLKSTLSGDKVPLCRVSDLEVTLADPDIPAEVRLPANDSIDWHSSPEVRAAEVQCMQLSLALLARHESEVYVKAERQKTKTRSYSHQDERTSKSRENSEIVRKHMADCEQIFRNPAANNRSTKANVSSSHISHNQPVTDRHSIRSNSTLKKTSSLPTSQLESAPKSKSLNTTETASTGISQTSDRRHPSHSQSNRTTMSQQSMLSATKTRIQNR